MTTTAEHYIAVIGLAAYVGPWVDCTWQWMAELRRMFIAITARTMTGSGCREVMWRHMYVCNVKYPQRGKVLSLPNLGPRSNFVFKLTMLTVETLCYFAVKTTYPTSSCCVTINTGITSDNIIMTIAKLCSLQCKCNLPLKALHNNAFSPQYSEIFVSCKCCK